MAYDPTTWAEGDEFTAAAANKYEQALAAHDSDLTDLAAGINDVVSTVNGLSATHTIANITPGVDGAAGDGVQDDTAVIQGVIDTGGQIFVSQGTYRITAPLQVTSVGQRIELSTGAELVLDSGYSGDVWVIGGGETSIRDIIITGGTISEVGRSGGAAQEPGTWTAVRFLGASAGTTSCTVQNMQIKFPGTAFAWEVTGTGWANANRVVNCQALYPRIMINCDLNGGTQVGFSGNAVRDLMGQSGDYTVYGIKGLTGRNWRLDSVSLWDIGHNPSAVAAEILPTAGGTIITGGLLTGQNYDDQGTGTVVMDYASGFKVGGLPMLQPLAAHKTATTTRNNTDTLTDDPHLQVEVEADAVYAVTAYLDYDATTTADIAIGWTTPTGATLGWTANGLRTAAATRADTTDRAVNGTSGTKAMGGGGAPTAAMPMGTLTTNWAGTFALKWAQSTAEASDAQIRVGSWLNLTRIA